MCLLCERGKEGDVPQTMSNTDKNARFAIEARGLYKSFGSNLVLNELDLSVSWGSLTVLFGANGSGKSTLIKNLATISTPTSGKVLIAGLDIKKEKAQIRSNIGVITHELLLYSELTAYQNLLFYGKLFGLSDIEQRIHWVTNITGTQTYLGKQIKHMSHGMQKRVSIARAILHDPAILFLDEPETGLDQEAVDGLHEMIGLGLKGRRTILMTTHSLDTGFSMADTITVLSGGKISYNKKKIDIDRNVFEKEYANLRHNK